MLCEGNVELMEMQLTLDYVHRHDNMPLPHARLFLCSCLIPFLIPLEGLLIYPSRHVTSSLQDMQLH